jgi:DNA-binding IclR family transcriptional regulator
VPVPPAKPRFPDDDLDFAFLTNHAKTLLLVAHDPRIRMAEVARQLGITERSVHRIIADLANAGYLHREREGRRNVYTVNADLPFGLRIQRDLDIRTLFSILGS